MAFFFCPGGKLFFPFMGNALANFRDGLQIIHLTLALS